MYLSSQGEAYTLNDTLTAGPGDVTWALEWDKDSLAGGNSFSVSVDNNISAVPVPPSLLLLGSGLAGLGLLRRKWALKA